MNDPIFEAQRKLDLIFQQVTNVAQGMSLMAQTQATQTEMLRQIMEAAADEPGPSPVALLLERLCVTLEEQTVILRRIEAAQAPAEDLRLPDDGRAHPLNGQQS